MKIKLYKKFSEWNKGGCCWVISDTHFNDADCKLMSSDWVSPEEQVKRINSVVGKKDTLIHLGDVGTIDYVKQLKGYKVLICGNHDRGVSNYTKKYRVFLDNELFKDSIESREEAEEFVEELKADFPHLKATVRDNGLFDEVYDGPLFISDKILLSHEPIELPFGFNIHGHTHNGKHIISNERKSVKINMCADVVNYTPIRLDKLIEGNRAEDIHRQTIDFATLRAKANIE